MKNRPILTAVRYGAAAFAAVAVLTVGVASPAAASFTPDGEGLSDIALVHQALTHVPVPDPVATEPVATEVTGNTPPSPARVVTG